jgi:hypothetical protein
MKVTLDLTDLVSRGELTKLEADRLARLGARDTGSLASNIFLSFGVVTVALGLGALVPSPVTAIVLGGILFVVGLGLILNRVDKWGVFAQVCVTLGALAVVGGISYLSGSNLYVAFLLAIALAAAAAVAVSGLLAALAVLQLTVALGAGTEYWHASYGLWVERPALSIGVLAVVTLALYFASLRLPPAYERIAIIAARTAILMINLAFLVGTLFGDPLLGWPSGWFTIVWAALLLGVGLWAVAANRRWVVNAAAVFGALHFYTQWFEYLGPQPIAILGGGLLLLAFGFALRWLNTVRFGRSVPAAP